jgi:hypothetical protein
MNLATCELFFARAGLSPRQILGLPEKGPVTERQITEAYRQKARELHPDKQQRTRTGGLTDDQGMKLLNTAYKYEWDMHRLSKDFNQVQFSHTFKDTVNIQRSGGSKPWLNESSKDELSVLEGVQDDSEDDDDNKQMVRYEDLKAANSVLDDTYASYAMILQTSDGSKARFMCPTVPKQLRANYVPISRTPKEKIIDMPGTFRASDLRRGDVAPPPKNIDDRFMQARLMESFNRDRERADRILLGRH